MIRKCFWLVFLATHIFSGCDYFDPYAAAQLPEPLEIVGTWTISNIDVGSGAENCTASISNLAFDFTFSSSGSVGATILEYDNDADFLVCLITSHFEPSGVGKYMKIAWVMSDSTHFSMSVYSGEDTREAAKSSSAVVLGPWADWTKQ